MVLGVLTANRKLNTSYLTLDVHVDKYGRGEQVSRASSFAGRSEGAQAFGTNGQL